MRAPIITSLVIFLNTAFVETVFGQAAGPEDVVVLDNPLGVDSIGEIIQNVLNGLILIAAPIVAIMILVGGFQIMFAAGDPEKFKTGKKTILYTVIGYAILLVASGISTVIQSVLSGL